jgi:capsular polysaccharide transport system permease protein
LNNTTSLTRSLEIQFRVIGALLMREVLTRYGRHNIGFLWLFLEPMMFTAGVTTIWALAEGHKYSNIPISLFALTGYSTVLLWRNMPNRCSGSIEPNLSLMYHRNVKVIDIFLSRILLELAGATTSFIILGIFFTTVGWIQPPENYLKIIFAWFMICWFGAALAMGVGALCERSELVEKLWHPLSYLTFPLSGAGFMVDWLPDSMQQLALYVPMVHGVEMLRDGYFGSSVHTHYDMMYFATFNLCLTLLALSQVRVVSRTVMPE